MTTRLSGIITLLVVAGCGSESPGTGKDMAMSGAADMTQGGDMAQAGGGDMAGSGAMTVDVSVGANGSFKFAPDPVNIKVGDTVKWTFAAAGHNVVSISGNQPDDKFCSPNNAQCAMAPTASAGVTYSHTFNMAGAFPYACMPHLAAGMKGTVNVAP